MLQGKSTYSLNLLSKYRGQLMGLAAIFIMVCHNSIYFPHSFYRINFRYIRPFFQFGVDIFLLLSGIGCFYSFAKLPKVIKFFKKRFIRLVPTYVIFVFFNGIWQLGVNSKNITEYLKSYSVISFFTSDELLVWFVAAIIVLYLMFPLIYKLALKSELAVWGIIIALYAINYIPVVADKNYIDPIFIQRIPSFLLGVMIAKRIRNGEVVISNKKVFLSFAITFALIVLFVLNGKYNDTNRFIVFRTLFFPTCYFFSVSVVCLFEKIKLYKSKCGKLLGKIGEVSFETYLIHVPLLGVTDRIAYRLTDFDIAACYASNILAIIIAILLGFALKWLSSLAIKPLTR